MRFNNSQIDPFDSVLWDSEDALAQFPKTYNLRPVVFFKVAELLKMTIEDLTSGATDCFLTTVKSMDEEGIIAASKYAKTLSNMLGVTASILQRDIKNGLQSRSEANSQKILKLRKLAVALKWMHLREFDDASLAFAVIMLFEGRSIRQGLDFLYDQMDRILESIPVETEEDAFGTTTTLEGANA